MVDGIAILLIEDNVANREVVAYLLRSTGHRVLTAVDGQEGLEIIQAGAEVELVITDAEMPRLDGHGVCKAIRASAALRHLPIIALTGHDSRAVTDRLLEAGADSVLVKPARLATINQAIESVLAPGSVPAHQLAEPASPSSSEPALWLRSELLDRLEGDTRFLIELVQVFMDDTPRQLVALHDTIRAGGGEPTRRVAHTLKGAAANMSAEAMRRRAHRVEEAARDGEPVHRLEDHFYDLQETWEITRDHLGRAIE